MRSLLTYLTVLALTAGLGSRAYAYTAQVLVTPAYVREHPNEWSVKVAKKGNGLIEFTIVRTLSEPMYLDARLAVHHAGRVIAESNSLAFGRKQDNPFRFALSPDDLAESTFELIESTFTVIGDQAIPTLRGPIVYQFRLLDFVSEDVLKPGRGK